ncbi:MAG: glycosyl transferase, partial [Phycisphaerales bacterium]|nr:glycosyl transferase [Phycisphaerales bacterium]
GGARLSDILSGYRVFNRRVAKCLPVLSSGFEVETEMTIQMLFLRMHITELPTPYRPRPEGSRSKLRTCRDGSRVLWKIFTLFRQLKPLTFFGLIAIVFFLLGFAAGVPAIHDYLTLPNHEVKHVPLAILSVGLMLISAGNLFLGVLLHSLNWRFIELHNVLARRK